MDKSRRQLLAGGSATLLAASLTGCGTLLYPERKGQGSGRLDPSIVMLDGIGLLLFLVPGIIAFAVDFGNDTIYLPGSRADASDVIKETRVAELTKPEIDRIWQKNYGENAPFELNQVERRYLHTGTDVAAVLSASAQNNYAPV
ncbi:hypothetical protein [Hyphomonas sp.]|uniref:hypothetical protein n=1 Tax=Hyphomonas sp. TaxID=87 RepID=UPI0032421F50